MDAWSQAATSATSSSPAEKEEKSLGLMQQVGNVTSAQFYNRLIRRYVESVAQGDREALFKALDVLADMRSKGVELNLLIFNSILAVCKKAAATDQTEAAVNAAFQILRDIKSLQLQPDLVTFNLLLETCSNAIDCGYAECFEDALSTFDMMQEYAIRPNIATYNMLLFSCSRAAQDSGPSIISKCFDILDLMQADGMLPDISVFNAMIDACAKSARGDDGVSVGLQILERMASNNIEPDVITYNSLINVCAMSAAEGDTNAFVNAREILNMMLKAGVRPNVVTFNSLATIIVRAVQAGEITDPGAAASQGQQVIDMMSQAGVQPNVITYNAILSAVVRAKSGDPGQSREEIMNIITKMSSTGILPNAVTFQMIMEDLGKLGKSTESQRVLGALQLLQVKKSGDDSIFNYVVDICQRSEERVKVLIPVIKYLADHEMIPNVFIFNALLSRCKSFGGDGLKEAITLVDLMIQHEVKINEKTMVLVDEVRKAHEEDPELRGVQAWDLFQEELEEHKREKRKRIKLIPIDCTLEDMVNMKGNWVPYYDVDNTDEYPDDGEDKIPDEGLGKDPDGKGKD